MRAMKAAKEAKKRRGKREEGVNAMQHQRKMKMKNIQFVAVQWDRPRCDISNSRLSFSPYRMIFIYYYRLQRPTATTTTRKHRGYYTWVNEKYSMISTEPALLGSRKHLSTIHFGFTHFDYTFLIAYKFTHSVYAHYYIYQTVSQSFWPREHTHTHSHVYASLLHPCKNAFKCLQMNRQHRHKMCTHTHTQSARKKCKT